MEVDVKTVVTIAVAVLGGGGAGFGVTEARTTVELARQQVQIDNIREVIVSRIAEHKSDQEVLKADFAEDIHGLGERLDRHGARLLVLEKGQ